MSIFKRIMVKSSSEENKPKKYPVESGPVSSNLNKNEEKLREIFSYPLNQDFIIREVYIKGMRTKSRLFYLFGAADVNKIETDIIEPLQGSGSNHDNIDGLISMELKSSGVVKRKDISDIVKDILEGHTILIVNGFDEAISLNTVGFEHRSVEKPQNETTLKGPKEAFIESLEVNTSLIRKLIRDENLVKETITIGERGLYKAALFYIKNLANPELVEGVKNRIKEIQTDSILQISELEQHIEERPYSLVPTLLYTERPDRAASYLMEGHVVILDQSAGALVAPVTFWSLFQTSEDYYQRWAYGNFIRLIRALAFFIALLIPSLYIGITSFHPAMLPIDLLLPIAATREVVPFPVVFEVVIMEIAFEILREASTRIPTIIGPTIGIVGALILGQAAVEANLVSPILVIIVSITGLSSFAIPNMSANYMVRLSRFIFLIGAIFMGFYGIAICTVIYVGYFASLNSFGVPFLSPMAPHYPSSKDTLLRPPIWKMWLRPLNIYPNDKERKKKP